MTKKKTKRVFAGFYRRYDGAFIQVLTVVDDVDTGSKVVFFVYEDRKHYDGKNHSMTIESFCADVEYNGKVVPKFIRYTKRQRDPFYENKLDDLGFHIPRKHRKKSEIGRIIIRRCRACLTYEEYAKDICVHYNEDINRYNKTVETKRYVGVMGAEEFNALKEDIYFTRDCFKTSLRAYYDIFKKRYVEGLTIRKSAEVLGISKGSLEYKEKKMLADFAAVLKCRDEQDGINRLNSYLYKSA